MIFYRHISHVSKHELITFMQEHEGEGEGEADPRVVSYLQNGHAFVSIMEAPYRDVIDGEYICSAQLMTDGRWIWHSDYSFYVEKYSLEVPEKFLRHMAQCDWSPSNRPPSMKWYRYQAMAFAKIRSFFG